MLGCAVLLTSVGLGLGLDWRVALVAALGLSLSSTAIALQVMQVRNMLPTGSGQAAFSILLFQDVAAIPILALLPFLAISSVANEAVAHGNTTLAAIKTIAVIVGIILGGACCCGPCFAG